MSDVTRYEAGTEYSWGDVFPRMTEAADGEWVRHSDYAALASKLARITGALKDLTNAVLESSPYYQPNLSREEVDTILRRHQIEYAENTTTP